MLLFWRVRQSRATVDHDDVLKILAFTQQTPHDAHSYIRPILYVMQACIYLLRICTIPRRNQNETTFPNFQINIFLLFQLQNHMTRRLHIIYVYLSYIQLVSFQTKKIWENETYFHYLSERLQLLHFCGHSCLQRVEKFYLLFSSRTCLGLKPELHL